MTGAEVRRLRRRRGWTQQQMAKELGLRHRNSVGQLEALGARRISPLAAIAVNCVVNHRRR